MAVTSNPKDEIGSLKYPLQFVSRLVWGWVGVAMFEGARKYGGHNYRVAGVKASVNTTAAQHHIDAFWEGQDLDPDSGLHHLAKAIAALTVMFDGVLQENWVDDRPPRNPNFQAQVDAMNAATKALIERYPEPAKNFTEFGNEGIRSKFEPIIVPTAVYSPQFQALMEHAEKMKADLCNVTGIPTDAEINRQAMSGLSEHWKGVNAKLSEALAATDFHGASAVPKVRFDRRIDEDRVITVYSDERKEREDRRGSKWGNPNSATNGARRNNGTEGGKKRFGRRENDLGRWLDKY